MKFGPTPLEDAEGAILAHSLKLDGVSFRKGRLLSAADIARLASAGVGQVTAARLEADDVPEDRAAERIAAALQPHLDAARTSRSAPFTGRANLFAESAGLFRVSRALIDAANAVDPSITIATLHDATWVGPRQMTATVKIIPYAAPERAVGAVEALLRAAFAAEQKAAVVVVSAAIEAELAQLSDPAEKQEFLETLGLEEPGLARVIRAGYDLLGLITFFTAGPKEARAWTVRDGAKAPEAAGVIHTDFERGFIRAETIAYDDYIACGGENGAKDAGKMRAEGRDYRVRDGDVLLFRFNV